MEGWVEVDQVEGYNGLAYVCVGVHITVGWERLTTVILWQVRFQETFKITGC